jgi:hypothetical protein
VSGTYVGRHRKGRRLGALVVPAAFVLLAVPTAILAAPRLTDRTSGGASAPSSPGDAPEFASRSPATPTVGDFDIVASGDLLIHSSIYERAVVNGHYDFRPMFAAIKPIVSNAALAICHVETPIGAGPPSGYPIFDAPVELADAIAWTGWDVCDAASNHTLDRGQDGVDATLDALDAAGVKHAGSYRSASEAGRILIVAVDGVKVAFLAYTYGTNGIALPNPWSVNLISEQRVEADAKRARSLGAQLVIVNFHWGNEYVAAPSAQQSALADALLGGHVVDLIVGQHVHVVQPIERIAGRFVVYGEGNLISAQGAFCCPAGTQDGLIAVIHVHATGADASITGVDYVPVFIQHFPSYEVLPVGITLQALESKDEGDAVLAGELRSSYERTVAAAGTGPGVHAIPAMVAVLPSPGGYATP